MGDPGRGVDAWLPGWARTRPTRTVASVGVRARRGVVCVCGRHTFVAGAPVREGVAAQQQLAPSRQCGGAPQRTRLRRAPPTPISGACSGGWTQLPRERPTTGAVRSGVSELRRVTLRVRVSRRRRHPRSTARCCAPGCPVASPPATHMRCHRARRTVAGAAWVRPHVQQPRRRAVTCFEQGAGGPVGFPWERGPTQHPEPQTLNPP